MSMIYDFFLTDIQYESARAPWTHFSSGCFSCLRTIFGGRKIEVLDGIITKDEEIHHQRTEVRWIEVALAIFGLIIALPLGIIPRIATFLDAENRLHLGHIHVRDRLKKTYLEILDEDDRFPKTQIQWSIYQLSEPVDMGPFIAHFEKTKQFSLDLCESLRDEGRGDVERMVAILRTKEFHHNFYYTPRAVYGNFRAHAIEDWLSVRGKPQYELRKSFNDLVDQWNNLLENYQREFRFSKDEDAFIGTSHDTEEEFRQFRAFLGEAAESNQLEIESLSEFV